MTEAATGHGRERDSCPMLDPTVHTRIYIYTHISLEEAALNSSSG